MEKPKRMAKYTKQNLTYDEIYQKEAKASKKMNEAHAAYEKAKSDHKMYKETGQYPDFHFNDEGETEGEGEGEGEVEEETEEEREGEGEGEGEGEEEVYSK